MGIFLALAVALLAWGFLLGERVFTMFGVVVSCATFAFPAGLIGLVAAGVALLLLLAPHHQHRVHRIQ